MNKSPQSLTPELVFLGEIPNNDGKIPDDSALVYKSKKGLVIIVGCSHSGLKNIIEYAKKVTGETKIYDIIGGYHLIDKTEGEIKELIEYLKTQDIEILSPSHCCNLKSKILLAKEFLINDVTVGDCYKY